MIYTLVRFRKLAQVGVVVLCIVGCAPVRASARPIAPFARKDSLSIVDVHGHLNGDMSAEQLIELMDKSGVSRMVLMPRYFGGRRSGGSGSDEQALEYAKGHPGRFIPFVAGQRDMLDERGRWLNPDREAENLLRDIETELRTQEFYGIGELIIRHYAFGGSRGGRERDIPVNTPLMGRFAELAARYEVPLLIHAEGEPDVVAGMKQILEKNPKTRIIWAHNCGRSSPEIIRAMLAGHLNLSCDLGGMLNAPFAPYGRYWPKQTPWMFLIEDGNGALFPEMKALYEAFANRFFLGTDPAFTPSLRTYPRRIERFRELLSGLTAETARRLGFQNADELFRKGGKE
jgi:Tat protein secretion system quality control protein TatD with DNase activity